MIDKWEDREEGEAGESDDADDEVMGREEDSEQQK